MNSKVSSKVTSEATSKLTSKRPQKGAETEHFGQLANSGPAYGDSLQNSRVFLTGHIAQSPSHSLSQILRIWLRNNYSSAAPPQCELP